MTAINDKNIDGALALVADIEDSLEEDAMAFEYEDTSFPNAWKSKQELERELRLRSEVSGNPTLVIYKLRGLLAALGYHNILSVPWIAAANLIANRTVVPEHCFANEAGWQSVLRDAQALWRDQPTREQCEQGLREVRDRLGQPGATSRVAAIVQRFLQLEPKTKTT